MRKRQDGRGSTNNQRYPLGKTTSSDLQSSDTLQTAPFSGKRKLLCGRVSTIKPTTDSLSSTKYTDTIRLVSLEEFLSGGEQVAFRTVLESFQLPSFSNATSDEAMFLVSAYFHGFKEAEHLAATLHWKCQRPLQALRAAMNARDRNYSVQNAKRKRLSNSSASLKKRSSGA
jgi:hypothetical protein